MQARTVTTINGVVTNIENLNVKTPVRANNITQPKRGRDYNIRIKNIG